MKLLNILKLNLKEWPADNFIAYQSWGGKVFFINGFADYENGGWFWEHGLYKIDGPRLEIAEDLEWAFVCKFQWEDSNELV